jgi:hypothetical protein
MLGSDSGTETHRSKRFINRRLPLLYMYFKENCDFLEKKKKGVMVPNLVWTKNWKRGSGFFWT